MSSRRSVRTLLVAVLLGVLVGGGLMAVTPAGAQVSSAAATSWKKIWKKNLKPLADKRYYTKRQSDATYQPKGSYEAAGSGWSKAESDARYAAAGSSYSKAEIDTKLAPIVNSVAATAGGEQELTLTPAAKIVRSVSIMPPANGSVIVSGVGNIRVDTAGFARCSLTTGAAVDFDFLQVVSGAPTDYRALSATRGFAVTKNNLLTVNYVCEEASGEHVLRDSSLTAIFAPS